MCSITAIDQTEYMSEAFNYVDVWKIIRYSRITINAYSPSHINGGLIMNLINETHHSCEKKEYAFIVLREYTIISHVLNQNYMS